MKVFHLLLPTPEIDGLSITMPPDPDQTRLLAELIASTLTLLGQYTAFLTPNATPPAIPHIDAPPNPLHVLRDSGKLVKAHTTKIGLLAINKPFTPSAIRKVLDELRATCIPAMMSASQICYQQQSVWSAMMADEVRARVRRVFKELETLLQELESIAKDATRRSARRDSLSSTGVVWESCDAVIELDSMGIGGLAVRKAEEYRDTIKDAIEELREWKEGEDLDSEGHDELLDEGDEAVEGDKDSIEDIFNAANSMPKDRPELAKLVDAADGKLKKIVLLYTALIKRRLKTFKAETSGQGNTSDVERMDKALLGLKSLPEQVDDLAGCFYDLDEERVEVAMSKCFDDAMQVSKVMQRDWQEKEDEFTIWSGKWKEALG